MIDEYKFNLSESSELYFKDNKNCLYQYKVAGIPFCLWNAAPCERIPFTLCATHNTKEEEEKHE